LQMIQNAPARLVFIQPKRAHVTPLLIDLHWLPVAARIKFKSLMLAYSVLDGSAPTYLNNLVRANVTPTMLRSSSERLMALPSVQVQQSRLFSFVVPLWWNELPSTTRAGASLSTFKKLLKTLLFREHFPSSLALRLVRNLQLQQLHYCTSLSFYLILLYFLCKVVFIVTAGYIARSLTILSLVLGQKHLLND